MCGSPEPLDSTDTGPRGYVKGILSPEGLRIRWIRSSTAEYRTLEIQTHAAASTTSVLEKLRPVLQAYPDRIFRLRLTGDRAPDMVFDRERLLKAGRIAEVEDATVPAWPLEDLLSEHRHDLIGRYIETLNGKNMPEEKKKKALAFGLAALTKNENRGPL